MDQKQPYTKPACRPAQLSTSHTPLVHTTQGYPVNTSKSLHPHSTYCSTTRALHELAHAQPNPVRGQGFIPELNFLRSRLCAPYHYLPLEQAQDDVPTTKTRMDSCSEDTVRGGFSPRQHLRIRTKHSHFGDRERSRTSSYIPYAHTAYSTYVYLSRIGKENAPANRCTHTKCDTYKTTPR